MAYYKINFSGFCYVEANSPEEALERAEDDMEMYKEWEYDIPEEIDDPIIAL